MMGNFMKNLLLIILTLSCAAVAQAKPINCDMIVSRDVLVTGWFAHRNLFQTLKAKGYNAVSNSNFHPGQEGQMLNAGNYLYIQIHYLNEFGTAPDSMSITLEENPGTGNGTNSVVTYYDVPKENNDSGNSSKILAMVAKIPSCPLLGD